MSIIVISGYRAEYKDNYVLTHLDLGKMPPYRRVIEAKKIEEVQAALEEAKAALVGQDAVVSAYVKSGRKPNGFDRYMREAQSTLYVRKEAA